MKMGSKVHCGGFFFHCDFESSWAQMVMLFPTTYLVVVPACSVLMDWRCNRIGKHKTTQQIL